MFLNFFCKILLRRNTVKCRLYSKDANNLTNSQGLGEPVQAFDTEYYLNPKNYTEIATNISKRKGVGNIDAVLELNKTLNTLKLTHPNSEKIPLAEKQLWEELRKIPNKTHPEVQTLLEEPKVIELIGEPRKFNFKPRGFLNITEGKHFNNDLVRTEQLTLTNGPRSYIFKNDLAVLEQAIIYYTVDKLKQEGFSAISVPDTIDAQVIESCGMTTKGRRSQVFALECPNFEGSLCLSGTAEMAIGGFYKHKCFDIVDLPAKVFSVSRCYRAEVSNLQEEKGIYRVHEFTKIEMFGLTSNETGNESHQLLELFCKIQKSIFSEIGLHYKVLDMPPHELGASAYRKFDIETWFPPKRFYGEISSASNCTDYQSRRLGIKYKDINGVKRHAHTVNATACAIPRIIMAIVENFQNKNGTVPLPECLVPYMYGKKLLGPSDKKLGMFFQKLKSV